MAKIQKAGVRQRFAQRVAGRFRVLGAGCWVRVLVRRSGSGFAPSAIRPIDSGLRRTSNNRQRHQADENRGADGKPRGAPAARLHERADDRKRDHEADAQHDAVDRHRHVDAPHEPMPDHGNADDGQRALAERARQRHRDGQLGERRDAAHQHDRDAKRRRDAAEDDSAAESIDEPADADGAARRRSAWPRDSAARSRRGRCCRSARRGSVMSPRPCVRPGSVPTIAAAATNSTTQP